MEEEKLNFQFLMEWIKQMESKMLSPSEKSIDKILQHAEEVINNGIS